MRSTANAEALFAGLVLLGNGLVMQHLRLVYANHSVYYDDYEFVDSGFVENDTPINFRSRSIGMMTCNCSWGSVPRHKHRLKLKIVGGERVLKNENFPMIAGIQFVNQECTVCGSTILTEYHVLTAAHCVYNLDLSEMILAVGVHNRCREKNDGGQYIPLVETPYVHEEYDEYEIHNDIAILLTKRKIIFGNNVGPTCIHTEPFTSKEAPILILGWGKLAEDLWPGKTMNKVFVKGKETQFCVENLPKGYINKNLHLQLCTYGEYKDACAGDSGGPLFVVDKSVNRLSQIALVSMGEGCARLGVPAVNTALYRYIGWMKWTIHYSMRRHYPEAYKNCDSSSFCYTTSPKVE